MKKKLLSVLLIMMLLVTSLPSMAFAEDNAKKNYLFMGDSMSYNFVNDRHAYTTELAKDGHYPAQLATEMGYNCINKLGVSPFSHGGTRATDIAAALSENNMGDNYTEQSLASVFSERAASVEMLSNADVITIQLGHSNFSTYGIPELMACLGLSDEGFGHDLKKIYTKDEIRRIKPLVQKCIQSISLTKVQQRALEKCINQKLVGKYRKTLVKIFGKEFVESIESIKSISSGLADTIFYILVSATVDFDRMMRSVIANKKAGAEIYVIGLFNPAPDLKFQYSIKKLKVTIPLKKLVGKIFSTMNCYFKNYSEYRRYYTYVNPPQGVETYYDLMAKADDAHAQAVTTEILTAYLCGGDFNRATDPEYAGAGADAAAMTAGVMKLAGMNTINLNEILDSDLSDLSLNEMTNNPDFLKQVTTLNEQGEFVGTPIELMIARIELLQMMQGVALHPTRAGHNVMAANLISAVKSHSK